MQAGAQHVDRRLEQFRRRHRRSGAPPRGCAATSSHRRSTRIAGYGSWPTSTRSIAVAHGLQLGRVELGRVVRRREAGRDQQRVARPQRHVEVLGEVEHHLAARTGTAGLDEAQVARRDPGIRGEIELAQPAARAPVAEQRPDRRASTHDPRHGTDGRARPNHYLRGNGPRAPAAGTLGPWTSHALVDEHAFRDPRSASRSTRPPPNRCGAGWTWAAERCTIGRRAPRRRADDAWPTASRAILRVPQPAEGRVDVDDRIEDELLPRCVRDGAVFATARPLHVGRTTIVVQTDLPRPRRQAVSRFVTQTQAVLQ